MVNELCTHLICMVGGQAHLELLTNRIVFMIKLL